MKRTGAMAVTIRAGVFLSVFLYAAASPAWAAECKDGALSGLLDTACAKGNFELRFQKGYDPEQGPPMAADVKVMFVATGLVFQFPTVTLAKDDSITAIFSVGFRMKVGNFTGATLTADPATIQAGTSITVLLAPNINNDVIGSAPLDLKGTLMNMTSGVFRTATPVVRYSSFRVAFTGPVNAAPKFSLQFGVK